MTADLATIVSLLNRELRVEEIFDYPGAVNGLQLANSGNISRVIAAVDASLPVVQQAAADGPALLIVHHGMFWQGTQPVTGAFYRKLKTAIDADLAIYSCHLPLDVHPQYGNNILLARALGVQNPVPFLEHKGLAMGLRGEWSGSRSDLANSLKSILHGPVIVCPGGPDPISSVGIITGGAGSEVTRVAASGVDAFITGEGPHWSYPLAEEAGLNLFYAGHYATETFGVIALSHLLSHTFDLPCSFIDRPSGL